MADASGSASVFPHTAPSGGGFRGSYSDGRLGENTSAGGGAGAGVRRKRSVQGKGNGAGRGGSRGGGARDSVLDDIVRVPLCLTVRTCTLRHTKRLSSSMERGEYKSSSKLT